MATYNKFDATVEYLAEKVFDFQNDALTIVLTNTAPIAANSVYADISAAEIANGHGYTTGGIPVTTSSSGQTSGTYKLVLADVVLLASGGSVGPFRYFVLVDTTPTSPLKPLVGWWDYGASLTLATGESVTVDFSAVTGAVQIS